MSRRSVDSQPIKSEADAIGYVPSTPAGWEDIDPHTPQQALDGVSTGRCGVVQILSGDPPNPATGQIWLDTAGAGSAGTAVKTINRITADLTLTTSHQVLLCDATSGSIKLTLPDASSNQGRGYEIKKIDETRNTVTIQGTGDDTVEDATKAVLKRKNRAVEPRAEGTNWSIF